MDRPGRCCLGEEGELCIAEEQLIAVSEQLFLNRSAIDEAITAAMIVKKHVRPNPQHNIKGGIAEQESRISLSNVQLVCATCGPVRIGHEVRGDRKVRVCKKCGTTLDK